MTTPLVSNFMQIEFPNTAFASNAGETECCPSDHDHGAELTTDSDDEEVTAYFSELLQRVNGRSARAATPSTSEDVRETSSHVVAERSTAWEMPTPRSVAPEHQLDRRKMRELATEAARSAIYACEKHRFQQEARTCIGVAILAAILNLAFLKWGPVVHDQLVIAAWIPSVFALACISRTLGLSFRRGRLLLAPTQSLQSI
jgi:hypothetical protein